MLYFGDKLEPMAISKKFPHRVKTLGLFFFFPKKVFVSIPHWLFFFLGSDAKIIQKHCPIAFQKFCPKQKKKPTP